MRKAKCANRGQNAKWPTLEDNKLKMDSRKPSKWHWN